MKTLKDQQLKSEIYHVATLVRNVCGVTPNFFDDVTEGKSLDDVLYIAKSTYFKVCNTYGVEPIAKYTNAEEVARYEQYAGI